jgi:hypothetical protein
VGIRQTIAILLVLAGLSGATAACSASVSTGDSSTPGGSRTYTNDKYGFSLTYDTMFVESEITGGASGGSGSVFDVVFADPEGAQIGGDLVDGIQVSVYKLARTVKPGEIAGLKKEFQGLVTELLGSISGAEATAPLSPTQINGVPGYTFGYAYAEDSVDVTATTYFLLKGQYEYQVTEQASRENWTWLSPQLQAAVNSFTVE